MTANVSAGERTTARHGVARMSLESLLISLIDDTYAGPFPDFGWGRSIRTICAGCGCEIYAGVFTAFPDDGQPRCRECLFKNGHIAHGLELGHKGKKMQAVYLITVKDEK